MGIQTCRMPATLLSGAALIALFTATPLAHADSCDSAAISADLGQSVNVLRCHGDWAYVSNGEFGDSTLLARLDGGGAWSNYTGFPSSFCRGAAAADGVPAEELSSFRPC